MTPQNLSNFRSMYGANKGVLCANMYNLGANMVILSANPVSHIMFRIFMFLTVYSNSSV